MKLQDRIIPVVSHIHAKNRRSTRKDSHIDFRPQFRGKVRVSTAWWGKPYVKKNPTPKYSLSHVFTSQKQLIQRKNKKFYLCIWRLYQEVTKNHFFCYFSCNSFLSRCHPLAIALKPRVMERCNLFYHFGYLMQLLLEKKNFELGILEAEILQKM